MARRNIPTENRMDKLQIERSFLIWVHEDGKPPRKVTFAKGQVLDAGDVPAGWSADDWIRDGLAKAVS